MISEEHRIELMKQTFEQEERERSYLVQSIQETFAVVEPQAAPENYDVDDVWQSMEILATDQPMIERLTDEEKIRVMLEFTEDEREKWLTDLRSSLDLTEIHSVRDLAVCCCLENKISFEQRLRLWDSIEDLVVLEEILTDAINCRLWSEIPIQRFLLNLELIPWTDRWGILLKSVLSELYQTYADFVYRTIVKINQSDLICWFSRSSFPTIRHRILIQQCLFKINPIEAETNCWKQFHDPSTDLDAKGDVLDVLLKHSPNEETKQKAKKALIELGGGNRISVYDNTQNVHETSIEESAFECYFQLEDRTLEMPIVSFDEAKEWIGSDDPEVHKSYFRMEVDQTNFERVTDNLLNLFRRVVTFAKECKEEDTIRERLVEELKEMAPTCAHGIFIRLINALSGIDGFAIKMDFEVQISNYFYRELIERVQESKMADELLDGWTLDKILLDDHFRQFFGQEMSSIYETLEKEFENDVDNFNEIMTKILIRYNLVF